ncbi:hypothetical protein [Amycolatopsis cihanbeyliensis]|uniref:Uncharacterized protein n=1 Tax=Amycolatopsis cihanbeyliensis TaxID=1128664 RepID=A0A542CTP8_AMYCI|nr:hypothetical protein [Amycolatopsis cihanbeyliensis]TQI94198.1 hypothetical protein FB471_6356 [Amycolatopsis cihanbeyliensis]
MALHWQTGVSVESWVEIASGTEIRYEVNPCDRSATLFFGSHCDFVLHLEGDNLRRLAEVAPKAHAELCEAG